MLYSIAKKSGSRHELKNFKKLKDKAFRKRYNSGNDSSSKFSDSYLSRYSNLDEDI